MRYFIKLTKTLQAKNKPQLAIIKMLEQQADHVIINKDELTDFKRNLIENIEEINKLHPRCKPCTYVWDDKSYGTTKDTIQLYNPDLFYLSFYQERIVE